MSDQGNFDSGDGDAGLDRLDQADQEYQASGGHDPSGGFDGFGPGDGFGQPLASPGQMEAEDFGFGVGFDPDVINQLPQWTAESYSEFLSGSAAAKLADSGIAPLVAAARGYRSLEDEDQLGAFMARWKVSKGSKQGRRFLQGMGRPGADGMEMPWFSVTDTQNSRRTGRDLEPSEMQVRPSDPILDERGKPRKYEFVTGAVTPVDVHPSVPGEWVDSDSLVIFAEGLLKGDAALSAWLAYQGVDDAELGDASEGARERLTEIMEGLGDRLLVTTIAGVNNYSSNPTDWSSMDLRGREVWIAYDADLAKNINVWRAARDLQESLKNKAKAGVVKFLTPKAHSVEGGPDMSKIGVDDYLKQVGPWSSLISHVQDQLPPQPKADDVEEKGRWRVAEAGTYIEECFEIVEEQGGSARKEFYWKPAFGLAGRVKRSEVSRQATPREMRSGVYEEEVSVEEIDTIQTCVEVSWTEGGLTDGDKYFAEITGPEKILNFPPDKWVTQGARIPSELARHPLWPPSGEDGRKWLSAVKAYRRGDTQQSTRWSQMGWVPVKGSMPAFIAGADIVTDDETDRDAVNRGVDASVHDAADRYGLSDYEVDMESKADRQRMRENLSLYLSTMVKDEPFLKPAIPAMIIAHGLRPVVPLENKVPVYVEGVKGGGKSLSATLSMNHFLARGHSWTSLPGSVKDTPTSTELGLAYTLGWVMDDLAPNASPQQALAETSKVEDLARQKFNLKMKSRATADMTMRKSNRPLATLMFTAENPLTTASARERCYLVKIGRGDLNPSREPTDQLERMQEDYRAQSNLAGHLVRFVLFQAGQIRVEEGCSPAKAWSIMVAQKLERKAEIERRTSEIIKALIEAMDMDSASLGSSKRASEVVTDLLVTLDLLRDFAEQINMPDEDVEFFDLESEGSLGRALIKNMVDSYVDSASSSPGISLISSLVDAMRGGRGHVISADDPQRPPVAPDGEGGETQGTTSDSLLASSRLGWQVADPNAPRPMGPNVGMLVTTKEGVPVIIFDKDVAFNAARTVGDGRIPAGQKSDSSWESVWNEGLAFEGLPRKSANGKLFNTVAYSRGSGQARLRISGIPVALSTILNFSLGGGDVSADFG